MTSGIARPAYRFGPFRVDAAECRLFHGETLVDLSPRLVELLCVLVARPGELLTKEHLLATVWPDVIVTDNALTRAISDIRHALGDSAAAPIYIQTVARRGYRFVDHVDTLPRGDAAADVQPLDALAPYRAWIDGRLQLETLQVAALSGSVASFERAVALAPREALARAGLANARFMQYERTRADNQPAYALLQQSIADARAACTLDPALGEAWATLAFVLVSAGEGAEATAAARRANTLEPGNWRHEFRLAHATWGEERLRAVDRTLALFADFAFAHFLGAMVHIARRAWPTAITLLQRGATIQDRQAGRPATFPATGLHWLAGLVLLAQGHEPEAIGHLERECRGDASGALYAAEFAANAWDAIACVHLSRGEHDAALAACHAALQYLPGQARSRLVERIALERLGRRDEAARVTPVIADCLAQLVRGHRVAEAAIVTAADLASRGAMDDAAIGLEHMLVAAPRGFAGWTIPIEPLLAPLHGTPAFDRVLAILAERAA
jgi:DNA-binding winged helix-turn-helix (wHTH) protein